MPGTPIFDNCYRVFEGILTERECTTLIETLGLNDFNAECAGLRNLMSVPEVVSLARDERLTEICRVVTGNDLIPYKATLFNKTGKANWLVPWHQDTALPVETVPDSPEWGQASVKAGLTFAHAPTSALRNILALRIHLDASTDINGPLRVIPGSHFERIHDDQQLRKLIDNGPAESLRIGLGGVIAMSPLLVHASSKCETDAPRRVVHIEYAKSLEVEQGVRLAIS